MEICTPLRYLPRAYVPDAGNVERLLADVARMEKEVRPATLSRTVPPHPFDSRRSARCALFPFVC